MPPAPAAATVAVTAGAGSTLAATAARTILAAGREDGFRSAAMASRMSQLLIVDALYVGVLQRTPAAAQALHRTYDAVADRRIPGGRSSPDGRAGGVVDDIGALTTEAPNPRSAGLDSMPPDTLLRTMNAEDSHVASAVSLAIPQLTRVVEQVVTARAHGGRLIYAGAGTSGRLGVLDAAECPPTFGTDPGEVVGIIAGGPRALTQAVEGAEDDRAAAGHDLAAIGLGPADVVVALAASGRTPTRSAPWTTRGRSGPPPSPYPATARPNSARTPTSPSKSTPAPRYSPVPPG